MEIGAFTRDGEWPSTRGLNELYREIRTLGLETNLAELEAFGFTLIPNALSPEDTARMRDVAIKAAERRLQKDLDLAGETDHQRNVLAYWLLYQDPVFEKAVLNERPLALIRYLLGDNVRLSSLTSFVKGPGKGGSVGLHSDTANGVPAPFPPYSHVANCNYALTDYTKEGGALAMVPGSHRYCRQPRRSEVGLEEEHCNPDAIPIEVPAGTAIVWHGNTWHGSFPRTIPGLRLNLSIYYSRGYMEPQEALRENVPADLIARHGKTSRMARLLRLTDDEHPGAADLTGVSETFAGAWAS